MPLGFDSVSHGTIAFGFFNIQSDMLLLEHYFFFATEFCEYISNIAEISEQGALRTFWSVYHIDDSRDIGDLIGAIHGIHYTGFIGELYRRFPFPERPENFKQNPEGFKNQSIMEAIIEKYARHMEIPFVVGEGGQDVLIGKCRFSRDSFQELVRYVWRGGYPRWKDGVRPDYVLTMKRKTEQSHNPLFKGLVLGG